MAYTVLQYQAGNFMNNDDFDCGVNIFSLFWVSAYYPMIRKVLSYNRNKIPCNKMLTDGTKKMQHKYTFKLIEIIIIQFLKKK